MDLAISVATALGAIATLAAAVIALLVVKSINSFKERANSNKSTENFDETDYFKMATSRKRDKESVEKIQESKELGEEEQETHEELNQKELDSQTS